MPWSQNSLLSIVTWQRAGQPRNYVSVPRGKRYPLLLLCRIGMMGAHWQHYSFHQGLCVCVCVCVCVGRIHKQLNGFLLQEEQTVIHNATTRWLPSNLNN